ncbi:MAG: hypothetical protein VB084_03170 [Syntrophomonadaceae bacterium]|nr:hypothetical protein [Syntrophomonadaceae bacterium]
MDTDRIVKESKMIMFVTLSVGIAILAIGVTFSLMNIDLISNPKAIIGLSFIPLSVAFAYYIKLSSIKKSPQKMCNLIITENDERLVALKNEADAKTLKILQGVLFLTYVGYTLMVPEDIFESTGWWLLMILLLFSLMLQGILLTRAMGNDTSKADGE